MEPKDARRSAFVLRIWQDLDGNIWGQVNQPVSGWQRPFKSVEQLCELILGQMGAEPKQNGTDVSVNDVT